MRHGHFLTLTAFLDGELEHPLPYVQELDPGSWMEWLGGTIAIRSDSTWERQLERIYCPSGDCRPALVDTIYGTYSDEAAPKGYDLALDFHPNHLPPYQGNVIVLVRGSRLEYGQLLFRKE